MSLLFSYRTFLCSTKLIFVFLAATAVDRVSSGTSDREQDHPRPTSKSVAAQREKRPRSAKKEQHTYYKRGVARVAFGSRVYRENCSLEMDTSGRNYLVSYGGLEPMKICHTSIKEIKSFEAGEHSPVPDNQIGNFISMRLFPKRARRRPGTQSSVSSDEDSSCDHILVEFCNKEQMMDLLDGMILKKEHDKVLPKVRFDENQRLSDSQVEEYARAFLEEPIFEGTAGGRGTDHGGMSPRRKLRSTRKRKQNMIGEEWERNLGTKMAFLRDRQLDDILLVYPFGGDPKGLETAAEGLHEAGTLLCSGAGEQKDAEAEAEAAANNEEGIHPVPKSRHRAHYLTIRVQDYERLDPGEFLNDSLIDFWMQW